MIHEFLAQPGLAMLDCCRHAFHRLLPALYSIQTGFYSLLQVTTRDVLMLPSKCPVIFTDNIVKNNRLESFMY